MNIIRFSKILFYTTIVILLFWLIPWSYNFFVARPQKSPFTLYSSVINDFAILDKSDKGMIRTDAKGNRYTEAQFDSILPMFYFRQLVSDGRFPDTLNNIALTPKRIQTENFIFRLNPQDVNTKKIPLYPLLESMSGRVDLKMPDDMFRITSKEIQFIDMASNEINNAKSALYTEALLKKGFRFPANIISGNPTTRKDYDEGYLLTDKEGQLFHFKQVKGRPFVRKIDMPKHISIKHIFLTEFKNRKYHAFLTDSENKLYALLTKSYTFQSIPIVSFNPEKERISIFGNLFDWTINISGEFKNQYYAIDAKEFKLLKSMEYPLQEETLAEKIDKWMPGISFISSLNKEVFPTF